MRIEEKIEKYLLTEAKHDINNIPWGDAAKLTQNLYYFDQKWSGRGNTRKDMPLWIYMDEEFQHVKSQFDLKRLEASFNLQTRDMNGVQKAEWEKFKKWVKKTLDLLDKDLTRHLASAGIKSNDIVRAKPTEKLLAALDDFMKTRMKSKLDIDSRTVN